MIRIHPWLTGWLKSFEELVIPPKFVLVIVMQLCNLFISILSKPIYWPSLPYAVYNYMTRYGSYLYPTS
jgi:hypothetical protein